MNQWNDHRELMDHEVTWLTTKLTSYGYRIDGKRGIKSTIKFTELKSADYIADNENLTLIEFSDLLAQQDLINKKVAQIQKSRKANLPLPKSELIKIFTNEIDTELATKFKDTKFLIEEMQKLNPCAKITNAYHGSNTPTQYQILFAPPNKDTEKGSEIDNSRSFDQLANKVSQRLPNQWNVRVQAACLDI